jgi:serralysin
VVVSGSNAALQSMELSFHQDLNSDGLIGPPPTTTVIETFGSTSLVKVGNNFYFDSISSGTGPVLKSAGVAVDANQTNGWVPIGAEQTASGYELAWKLTGADQYTVWATDSSGNYSSSPLVGVSGSNAALQSLELSFHQDLNSDGLIGPPPTTTTVIEALGSTSLVKVGNNFYLDSISSGTGPVLNSAGVAVDATQTNGWVPIGAEQTASGYELAWKLTGADQYTVWATDSSGNYSSSPLVVVSGSNAALKALEPSFHQDLNGDGLIGVTAPVASNGLSSSNPLWHSASNDVFLFGPGTSTGSIADAEQPFAGLDGFWSNEAHSSQFHALWQPASHAIIPLENHDSLALMNLHAFEPHNDFIIS